MRQGRSGGNIFRQVMRSYTQAHRKHDVVSVNFTFALAFFTVIAVRGSRLLLALYALALDAEPFTIGLLAATFSALPMLLAVHTGRISDRFGSRWPLAIGITGGGLGILVPWFFPSIPALFVAAALNGLAFSFYNVSLQNAIGLLSTTQTRMKNFATFTLTVSVANLIAPLIVGFCIDGFSHATACLVMAAVLIPPVALLVFRGAGLPAGTGKPAAGGSNIFKTLAEPRVLRVMTISGLMLSGFDLFIFYMPIYCHGIGLSASVIGIILAVFSAAGFLVRLALPWLLARFSVVQVLSSAFAVGAACFVVIPLFQNPYMLGLLAFVFGFGMSVGQPITLTLSFSNAQNGRSGEAMGLRQTVNHTARVLGPTLFGGLGSAFGIFAVFWVNALLLITGGLLARRGNLSDQGGETEK